MLKIMHRWLGLIIGLVLVVVSLSGSWLIYNREWREPEFTLQAQSQKIPLEQLYSSALTALDSSGGVVIRFPQKPVLPYQFWSMGDGHKRVFINQYSGEILAKYAPDYWPYGWVFELHTEFLLGHQGETILGIFGFLALFISLTGIILWLPKRGQRLNKHFKVRLNKSRYVRHFDLHRHIGILAAPMFILVFITGITLVFNKEFGQLTNWLANSQVVESPKPPVDNNARRINLDSVLETANTAMAGGRVGIMVVPLDNKPIVVRKQMQSDPHPNGLNFVHVDATTGKLLQVMPVSQADMARKLFNWIYPLHTGQAFKEWYDWLLFALGFVPLVMLFTAGMTFYLRNNFSARLKHKNK
jgi:uncharacterized iron-regulated membrane protein